MTRHGRAGDDEGASPPPVFLERHSYRRRRLTDAARLLPLLGAALFAVPLLWPRGDDTGLPPVPTSTAILYLFLVWGALIAANALFGVMTRGWMRADTPPDNGAD